MIDREKVEQCLKILDQLPEESADIHVYANGSIDIKIYPKNWYMDGNAWSDEKRHQVLSLVTPLFGKLEKHVSGRDIGYTGKKDNVSITMQYVDKCKILGYKTVTKTVKKEVEREPEYQEEEVEERIPITDCDIRAGKYSEDDIEASV